MTLRGSIDEYGHCWVLVTIVGLRQEISVEAILDTGFDGWVCLPMRLAIQLGLELCGFQTVELADGTQKEELVFSGEVIFGNKRGEVDISLTSGGDTLVGIGLLTNSVATIDLVGRTLEIVQKKGGLGEANGFPD